MRADLIFFVLMAGLGEAPQLEVDKACDERENALDLELKEIQNISKKYKFSQNVSTPKCTHLNRILAPRSHPTPCRLRHNKLKKVNAKLLKKY